MNVNVKQKHEDIGVGDLINFPSYGTWYVVHVCPTEVADRFGYDRRTSYTLFRMDGLKPYRKQPFYPDEIEDLVKNLKGTVYKNNKYNITLEEK